LFQQRDKKGMNQSMEDMGIRLLTPKYIFIDHGNGNKTLYSHVSQLNVGVNRQ
jgi:murein DD-endopeptidase MepM/ murein hydrolase activator NlpD